MIVKSQKIILSRNLTTENGFILKNPEVAFEQYSEKGPVILITHGGLSSHHAAGRYSENVNEEPGFWDALIGQGKPFDTNIFRVISVNSLGSMYGSTSPLSINPDTAKPYGPNFPFITMVDMVRFYKLFLDELGIKEVFIMAGPSMGSMQSLLMAALFPDTIKNVISVATAGRITPGAMTIHEFIISTLKKDPDFNNGNYIYTGIKPTLSLKIVHEMARIYYTHEETLKKIWDMPEGPDVQKKRSEAIRNYLTFMIEQQVQDKDPNCYITLLNAINTYNLGTNLFNGNYEEGVRRIKAKALIMNIDTDSEFPPYWGKEVVDILNSNTKDQATFFTVPSIWGHIGCLREVGFLADKIRNFIKMVL
ncbi:MAG TPA: alpha/beta fold hydrolase [Spirochaetota bacterium]|nr:alpha/beta fold hydrolase [Spirochaetota bacterium]HOM38075.1 alpha/beta fold hydrolase [Spirochaetota bacterium]HPQ48878.1 alpha/beta fold hydrolase [Spirochaetota bacterium]